MTPLMKDEVLVLFRLCNRNAEAFRPGKKTAFWSYIQTNFERETGKNHKNLYQVVQREIDKRRKYLDGLGTGQTDSESELTVQTDNWIGVVTEEKRIETQRSEAANTVITSSQRALNTQDLLSVALAIKQRHQQTYPQSRNRSIGHRARECSGFDDPDDKDILDDSAEERQSENGAESVHSIDLTPLETPTLLRTPTPVLRGTSAPHGH
ncbi:hypothetical protein GMDG_06272 [Pseudogymnoascus destructans 20631-21]|uniref:Myb/SANT-like domain-containing protein n=1 Tax=Pseudogymnoascus destructans (strain ATCC MYA-4855 / 20631-21) TaxID=658429 RepID=L8FRZ5_PSED2|nr:hypothetical protein GMDG_06272 [Pseudogymnoascus destructans 20631-21]